MFLYLCGALRQQRRLRLPLGELSHPWQPAGHPEPQTGPAGWTLRQAPGRGELVLTGAGPLANPGHAGRGAGPEAVAVERKTVGDRRKEILGDFQAMKEVAQQEVITRRKEREGTKCCDVYEGINGGSLGGEALRPNQRDGK